MYYMNPVRFDGHARTAQRTYGVRHFVIDHHTGLAPLLSEIDAENSVIFARMAVSHCQNYRSRFGCSILAAVFRDPTPNLRSQDSTSIPYRPTDSESVATGAAKVQRNASICCNSLLLNPSGFDSL